MNEQVSIYHNQAIDTLRAELRIDPQSVRKLRIAYFKKALGQEAALSELPVALRAPFAERVEFHALQVASRHDSTVDGATRLVLRTATGYLLESVILRSGTGRTSLCVSSQVGCGAACEFCATGKMGMVHDLSAPQILDQVAHAGELLARESRSVRNVVFMGMGEPFHNEPAVYQAVAALIDPRIFHKTPGRVIVSTVGLPDAMMRAARRFPEVGLALSLHSVRPEVRERIIPLARKYPLEQLRAALVTVNAVQRQAVMIEYLMLAGLNDSLADAGDLVRWLAGLRVHVNLIPYNPIPGMPEFAPSPRETRDAFAGVLKDAGVTTTIRYSLGADISAACGQLVQAANRRVAAARAQAHA